MNDETVNRILDMLERIGSEAATEGFALAVRYVRAEAIVSLLFALIALIVTLTVLRKSYLELTKTDDMLDANPLYFIGFLVGGFSIVGEFVLLHSGIMHLIVPEWYAVQALFGLVTGG